MDHDGRVLEEGVAAAMVGMQVRADHDVDVVGCDTDRREAGEHVARRRHDRRHDTSPCRPSAPRGFRPPTDGSRYRTARCPGRGAAARMTPAPRTSRCGRRSEVDGACACARVRRRKSAFSWSCFGRGLCFEARAAAIMRYVGISDKWLMQTAKPPASTAMGER